MSNFFKTISIIAESAQSYEGKMDWAHQTFDAAKKANADLVNIQVVYVDELSAPGHEHYDLFKSLEVPLEDWIKLFSYGKKLGLGTIASIFSSRSAEKLAPHVSAFKVHASDTANMPFLLKLAELGKPVLVGTGGATLGEINRAIRTLQKHKKVDVALLPGVQNFPTEAKDSHLARIQFLKSYFDVPVGYGDHIDADLDLAKVFPAAAVAAGADFVEKHINLDRALKREDFVSSLNPDEFALTTERLHGIQKGMGIAGDVIGEGEQKYREGMKKRVVAKKDLPIGHNVTYDDLDLLRTKDPGDLWTFESAIDRVLLRPVKKFEPIRNADLAAKPSNKKKLVAVLLCRVDSTRLFAKPLQLIGDKTIVEHLISQLQMVPRLDDIVLAISEKKGNDGFVQVAKKLGLNYVFGDDHDGLGRVIKGADFAGADTVLRVTTENPYIYLDNLDTIINEHFKQNATLSICENLPEGTYTEIIELDALKQSHSEGDAKHRSEFVSSFINQNSDRFKVVKHLPPEELRRPDIRLTVDYPEDLIVVRKIYEAFKGKMPIAISSIIDFLDKNPDIKNINGNIEAGAGRIWS